MKERRKNETKRSRVKRNIGFIVVLFGEDWVFRIGIFLLSVVVLV